MLKQARRHFLPQVFSGAACTFVAPVSSEGHRWCGGGGVEKESAPQQQLVRMCASLAEAQHTSSLNHHMQSGVASCTSLK